MSKSKDEDHSKLRGSFDAELVRSDLPVASAELPELFEGYCGLQGLLAHLPGDLPMAVGPAMS